MLPPAAVELLTALSKVLADWGRWYVFGAQAVIAYGVPRLSADVDVTVKLEPDDPQRFASAMKAAGLSCGSRIRSSCVGLEEALDQSDLLPAFESIAQDRP